MDYYTDYACYELSYRGHEKSNGKKGWIADNTIDVTDVVEKVKQETGFKPFLIGHSMGDVAQKYAVSITSHYQVLSFSHQQQRQESPC